MAQILCDHVEVAPRLFSGLAHLLAEGAELVAECAELAAEGAELAAEGAELAAEGAELVPEGAELVPERAKSLLEIRPCLQIHAAILDGAPQPVQASRRGYACRLTGGRQPRSRRGRRRAAWPPARSSVPEAQRRRDACRPRSSRRSLPSARGRPWSSPIGLARCPRPREWPGGSRRSAPSAPRRSSRQGRSLRA